MTSAGHFSCWAPESERPAGTGSSRCGPRERRSARPVPALRDLLHERPVLDLGPAGCAVSARFLRPHRTGRVRGGRDSSPPSRARQADRRWRPARRHGDGLRRLRRLGRMGLESGLRGLRGGDRALPAQIRKSAFPQGRISGRRAAARWPGSPAFFPTHTRRSEESETFQQFSTPIPLGLAASIAAAITSADTVLEPSAGTGLLAIFAELAGGRLVLNELADMRANLLAALFPAVTRHAVRRRADRRSPRRRRRAERGR